MYKDEVYDAPFFYRKNWTPLTHTVIHRVRAGLHGLCFVGRVDTPVSVCVWCYAGRACGWCRAVRVLACSSCGRSWVASRVNASWLARAANCCTKVRSPYSVSPTRHEGPLTILGESNTPRRSAHPTRWVQHITKARSPYSVSPTRHEGPLTIFGESNTSRRSAQNHRVYNVYTIWFVCNWKACSRFWGESSPPSL